MPGWVEPGGFAPAYGGGPTRPKAAKTKSAVRLDPPDVEEGNAREARVSGERASTAVAHAVTAEAPELFTRIATRGLRVWDLNHGRPAPELTLEQITGCPIQVAFVDAAEATSPWMDQRVRPPFAAQWVEYEHLQMLCGALIVESALNVYDIQFVTSSREGRNKPLLWPGPEQAVLTDDGRVKRRQPAIADPRNAVKEPQLSALLGAFNALYPHLCVLNSLPQRRPEATRGDAGRAVLPAAHHELGPVMLIWGDVRDGEPGSGLVAPRHAPVAHPVRGHPRALPDGRVVQVRPHQRGTGEITAGPRLYRVKRRQ